MIISIMVCFLCIAQKENSYATSFPLQHQPIGGEALGIPSLKPTVTPIKATRYPTAVPTPAFTIANAPTYLPTNPRIYEISCHQAIQGLNLSTASSASFQSALSLTIAYVTSVDPHGIVIVPVGAYNFICTVSNGCHVTMAYTIVAVNVPTIVLGGRLNTAIASGVFNNTLWANTGMRSISAVEAASVLDISPTFSPTARPTLSPSTFSPSLSTLSQFGNLAEIVGITVGGVVGVAVIIAIYLCCCQKGEQKDENRSQRIVPGLDDDPVDQEMKSRVSGVEVCLETNRDLEGSSATEGDKDIGYIRNPNVVVDLAGRIIVGGEDKPEIKKKELSRDWSIRSIRSSQFLSSFREESHQWSMASSKSSQRSPSSRNQFHSSLRRDSESGSHQPSPPISSLYEIFRRGSSNYLSSSPDRRDNLSPNQPDNNGVNIFNHSPDPQRASPFHPPLEF